MDLFNSAPFLLPDLPGYASQQEADSWRFAVPDGELRYWPAFLSRHEADALLMQWRPESRQLAWRQDAISLYGKRQPLPRLTAWYGDAGVRYTYSGISQEATLWTAALKHTKHKLEAACGTVFNSVLLNAYGDGRDHMGWHADDEPTLGKRPIIASLSLGAERDFVLRRNAQPREKLTLPLAHGSLLVMQGDLQQHWQHALPKRLRVSDLRLNLTFRWTAFSKQPANDR